MSELHWAVGTAAVTCVAEQGAAVPAAGFFPTSSPDRIAAHADWLTPWAVDADGNVKIVIQALCVESEGTRIVVDPHVQQHDMLVELERPDGGDPVLVPGNPIKMSKVAEGPETRVPWLGEHTDEVLRQELGCDDAELAALREGRTIA